MRNFVVLMGLLGVVAMARAQVPGVSKPVSPEEARKLLKIDKGLKVELVACEPQIASPVFMAFDPKGRIWVVEMRDYPNGPAKGEPPQGRIRVLEDKDGDGFFETSSIFAENLLFANGLVHWKDGVIVTAAPNISWLRDTDGDGKMDTKEILYEGFAAQNPQLRVSHPVLGIDGWIYVANGLRGGQVVAANRKDAKPVNLSGMDFRFDMLTGQYEAISGMGQFGNTFDDWGNRFVCDNRHHLRHIVLEDRYLKRNPYLAVPSVVADISELDDGPLNSGGKIYPLSKNWTTSNLHEGRFTAACGVHIYRGDLLGKPYRGAALTCDPTGNLVHMEILEPFGATFKSHPHQKGVEFLASPSDWFRPVSLAGGPDGALYVVDMNRAVIEHPEFMPPELKNRPDLNLGKETGRIWRIVPENGKRRAIKPMPTSLVELNQLLDDKNDWQRSTAYRLFLELRDVEEFDQLVRMKRSVDNFHRACLLDRLVKGLFGRLTDSEIEAMLNPKLPLTQHALRLAEQRLPDSDRLRKIVFDLPPSSDGAVLFRQALAVGQAKESKERLATLELILEKGVTDRWLRLAVYSALSEEAGKMLVLMRGRNPTATPLRELASLVGARGDIDEVGLVMRGAGDWYRTILLGLVEGMGRRGTHFEDFLTKHPKSELLPIWQGTVRDLLSEVEDKKTREADVLELLPILGHARWDEALAKSLGNLLRREEKQELRLAVVRVLGSHSQPDVAKVLMREWKSYGPAVRREVTEAMLRQPVRVVYLLNEIEKGNVRPGDIDPLRTRQLANHPQANLRERAKKLLAGNMPANRKEVLAKYQESLTLKGDAKLGQAIFKKNCATCHKVAGVGIDVGPDISDTRTKTLDVLLADILNPNQAIDNNYINYLVTTKSGKSMTGILAAETAASVTLKRAEGQNDVVLRSDIEEIQSTGVSLMPEELEKAITVREMADLLAFLKNWRYVE